MKHKLIAFYLLGLTMGILLFYSVGSFFGGKFLWESTAKTENMVVDQESMIKDIEKLESENARLKEMLDEKSQDHEEDTEKQEKMETSSVELVVESPLNFEKIAEDLVENGVYPHKNDLLMVMEMIQYNKLQGVKVLSEKGIILDGRGHKNILTSYDTHRYAIRKILKQEGLIQDEEAFSKVLYLLDSGSVIKPGKKIFNKNISLREVADVLMASP